MSELGVRGLRSDLPALIRRAAAGEATTITVNGRAMAVLGPLLGGATTGPGDVATLVRAGALIAQRRADRHIPGPPVTVWRNVRLDLLVREIR